MYTGGCTLYHIDKGLGQLWILVSVQGGHCILEPPLAVTVK